jgi:hypothetical protein
VFQPVKDEPSKEEHDVNCHDCGRRVAYTVEGKRIYTGKWFTCAYCSKPICEKCRKQHIALCQALSWNQVKRDKETGELTFVDEKPMKFSLE